MELFFYWAFQYWYQFIKQCSSTVADLRRRPLSLSEVVQVLHECQFLISLFQIPTDKPLTEPSSASSMSPLYDHLSGFNHRKELQEYLWPRPNYHLLWPGRPLPSLPMTKETPMPSPELTEMIARSQNEPFFGFFFNNNFSVPRDRERKQAKKEETEKISQFMDGPFFR